VGARDQQTAIHLGATIDGKEVAFRIDDATIRLPSEALKAHYASRDLNHELGSIEDLRQAVHIHFMEARKHTVWQGMIPNAPGDDSGALSRALQCFSEGVRLDAGSAWVAYTDENGSLTGYTIMYTDGGQESWKRAFSKPVQEE
jgi:hypothetical protein